MELAKEGGWPMSGPARAFGPCPLTERSDSGAFLLLCSKYL